MFAFLPFLVVYAWVLQYLSEYGTPPDSISRRTRSGGKTASVPMPDVDQELPLSFFMLFHQSDTFHLFQSSESRTSDIS